MQDEQLTFDFDPPKEDKKTKSQRIKEMLSTNKNSWKKDKRCQPK